MGRCSVSLIRMAATRIPGARAPFWLLERRLYRSRPADVAAAVAKTLLARAWAAACVFGSMVLLAWIAAFARAAFEHGWTGFRTLGGDSLSSASMQAARYEGDLVPVLAVWAALLLFTPSGFTIAFRGAAVAAAALGALDFAAPRFVITPWFAGFARGLTQFSRSWNGVLLLIGSVVVAYLLLHGAVSVFGRLDRFSDRRTRRPARAGRPRAWRRARPARLAIYGGLACRFAVALVVLLLACWGGAVVWLAASHAHGDATSYGLRGALLAASYLPILVVVAVGVTSSADAHRWLLAAVPLAALLGTTGNVWRVPRDLSFSLGHGELERIAALWGGGSLAAALLVGFPACLVGVYAVARVRP